MGGFFPFFKDWLILKKQTMRLMVSMFFVFLIIILGTGISSEKNVKIFLYYNLTTDNSLVINVNISHPHPQNISEVKLMMYNRLSTGAMGKILRMNIFHMSDDLCAQTIQQYLNCTLAMCINQLSNTNITLQYLFPTHSVFGMWYFQFEYYDNVQDTFKMIQEELDLSQYTIINEEPDLKLKIKKLTADKVELLCYSGSPLPTEPAGVVFPLTKVGFGFNNLLYFGELYQRNGNPYGAKCTHPVIFNSSTIHKKNDIKCFDTTNKGKDNILCIEDKPLFLFSDRQDIPHYFAGNLSFVNPATGKIYRNIPQNIIFELDIRSCFQVYSINDNENKNLCLPSSMVIEWIKYLSTFVSKYESLMVLPSDRTEYQCPAGKILTIVTNNCLANHHHSVIDEQTCNRSVGFTIFHNDTLNLKDVEERNECIINHILCFQNFRQRPGHVYLFPSSKPVVRPSNFNPTQNTNLGYLSRCQLSHHQQNLLELEEEIFSNASSKIANILVNNENLYCNCEQKPFTCFSTTNSSSEYPIATMTFNRRSSSMVYCFLDNIKSPAVNLNKLVIDHVCERNKSQDLENIYTPNQLEYSFSPFPLTTFNCANRYIEEIKKTCGLEAQSLMMVSLYNQYENNSIPSQNIRINVNYLDDKTNRILCFWNSSSLQHNIPISDVITSVMDTYCSSLYSPYKINFFYHNNTHVQCTARLKNNACPIQLQQIKIGFKSCTSNTCLENLRTERSLIVMESSSPHVCTVYYRYSHPQQDIITMKQTGLSKYTYNSTSVLLHNNQYNNSMSCLLKNIVPEVTMKRYYKHVLITAFLDTDCTRENFTFSVNISVLKINSYDKIYHKTINSRDLQSKNNNLRSDNITLHLWYDDTNKAILIPISDYFIQHFIQLYQSPIIAHVTCIYNKNNRTKTLEIPAWRFKSIYNKDQYNTHLQNIDRYTWPMYKPKSHQPFFEGDQTGFFVMIYLPLTLCILIPLLILILLCILCYLKPLVRERSILHNIWHRRLV